MEIFDAPIRELKEFEEISGALKEGAKSLELTGCTESGKCHFLHTFGASFDVRILITYSDLRSRDLAEEYSMYDKGVKVFPAKDLIFYQADIYSNEIPLEVLKKNILEISQGSIVEEKAIACKLSSMGYRKVATVEDAGQFAIRGGIVDIFDLTMENPIRLELWGDEVDSIRIFDVQTQRSLSKIGKAVIYPACEFLVSEEVKQDGFKKIEKEVKKCVTAFREKAMNEEAHRLEHEWATTKEQVEEFAETNVLESYIRYFYPHAEGFLNLFGDRTRLLFLDEPSKIDRHIKAVEEEFQDSFSHRIQSGYAIPGQADLLTPYKKAIKGLKTETVFGVTILDYASSDMKFEKTFHMGI